MREFVWNHGLATTLLVLLNFKCTVTLTSQSPCYNPDGFLAADNFPCFLGQNQSACCGGTGICDASGLCKEAGSIGVSELIRGTCTDPTWASPDCPLYCLDADTGGTNLISCQNVTGSDLDFCCDHSVDCCDTGIGRFQVAANTPVITLSSGALFSTLGTAGIPSSSSVAASNTLPSSGTSAGIASAGTSSSSGMAASSTSAIISNSSPSTSTPTGAAESTTSSAHSVPTTTSAPKSGLSSGAKAEIGAAIGAVALVGIIGAGFYISRSHRSKSELPDNSSIGSGRAIENVSSSGYELPGHNTPQPQELDNDWNSRGHLVTEYYKPGNETYEPFELTTGANTDGRMELP